MTKEPCGGSSIVTNIPYCRLSPRVPSHTSSADGDTCLGVRGTNTALQHVSFLSIDLVLFIALSLVHASMSSQETAFFDRAPTTGSRQTSSWDPVDTSSVQIGRAWVIWRRGKARSSWKANVGLGARDDMGEWAHMRDLICFWVLGANSGNTRIRGFACFGKGIVPRIEIFAFLLNVRHGQQNHSGALPSTCFAKDPSCSVAFHTSETDVAHPQTISDHVSVPVRVVEWRIRTHRNIDLVLLMGIHGCMSNAGTLLQGERFRAAAKKDVCMLRRGNPSVLGLVLLCLFSN